MKASDISVDRNLSILLKGPWGHGKTLAAASFAVDGPVYLAYWDKKKPIELVNFFTRMGKVGKRILDNIEYDVYGSHNANDFINKLIELSQNCRLFAFINDSATNMTSGSANWSLNFNSDRKGKNKVKILPDFDEYKVVTSIATQALDICRTLPCNVIWTCHPVSSIKIEGSGPSMKVSKVNPIVTYGNKAGDIIPGNFSEIYHFSKQSNWDSSTGKSSIKYLVSTEAVGDDFAKSNIGLSGDLDITNKLFYEVWKDRISQHLKELEDAVAKTSESTAINPFANQSINQSSDMKWNSEKGVYE
jgi:hypothetical protein